LGCNATASRKEKKKKKMKREKKKEKKKQRPCFSGLSCTGFASGQLAQLHVILHFLKKLLYYSSTLFIYLSSDNSSDPTCNAANVD
jgi:hypothetical protein